VVDHSLEEVVGHNLLVVVRSLEEVADHKAELVHRVVVENHMDRNVGEVGFHILQKSKDSVDRIVEEIVVDVEEEMVDVEEELVDKDSQ
jgi:phosphate uptake regulator